MRATTILALFALVLPLAALPPDAESLKSNRDAAIAKINATYGAELAKLQKKYMAAGNLSAANEVEKEIGSVVPDLVASGEPKLDGKWRVNDSATRTFSGTTLIEENGNRHSCVIKNSVIVIDWGHGDWEQLTINPSNPNRLKGVNKKGSACIYERLF